MNGYYKIRELVYSTPATPASSSNTSAPAQLIKTVRDLPQIPVPHMQHVAAQNTLNDKIYQYCKTAGGTITITETIPNTGNICVDDSGPPPTKCTRTASYTYDALGTTQPLAHVPTAIEPPAAVCTTDDSHAQTYGWKHPPGDTTKWCDMNWTKQTVKDPHGTGWVKADAGKDAGIIVECAKATDQDWYKNLTQNLNTTKMQMPIDQLVPVAARYLTIKDGKLITEEFKSDDNLPDRVWWYIKEYDATHKGHTTKTYSIQHKSPKGKPGQYLNGGILGAEPDELTNMQLDDKFAANILLPPTTKYDSALHNWKITNASGNGIAKVIESIFNNDFFCKKGTVEQPTVQRARKNPPCLTCDSAHDLIKEMATHDGFTIDLQDQALKNELQPGVALGKINAQIKDGGGDYDTKVKPYVVDTPQMGAGGTCSATSTLTPRDIPRWQTTSTTNNGTTTIDFMDPKPQDKCMQIYCPGIDGAPEVAKSNDSTQTTACALGYKYSVMITGWYDEGRAPFNSHNLHNPPISTPAPGTEQVYGFIDAFIADAAASLNVKAENIVLDPADISSSVINFKVKGAAISDKQFIPTNLNRYNHPKAYMASPTKFGSIRLTKQQLVGKTLKQLGMNIRAPGTPQTFKAYDLASTSKSTGLMYKILNGGWVDWSSTEPVNLVAVKWTPAMTTTAQILEVKPNLIASVIQSSQQTCICPEGFTNPGKPGVKTYNDAYYINNNQYPPSWGLQASRPDVCTPDGTGQQCWNQLYRSIIKSCPCIKPGSTLSPGQQSKSVTCDWVNSVDKSTLLPHPQEGKYQIYPNWTSPYENGSNVNYPILDEQGTATTFIARGSPIIPEQDFLGNPGCGGYSCSEFDTSSAALDSHSR